MGLVKKDEFVPRKTDNTMIQMKHEIGKWDWFEEMNLSREKPTLDLPTDF